MKKVPFYANTSDDTHCYQAALKMVLGYFLPNKEFSYDKLDTLTDKIENKWTWPQAGLVALIDMGFEVVILDAFDYSRFVNEKIDYLKDQYGEEVANEQVKHSDIPNAIEHINTMLKRNIKIEDNPDLELLRKYIEEGYLLICNINSALLNNKSGYIGHFVVVYEITDDHITFHDPGLPAHEARVESLEKFYDAWKVSKDAYAFRLSNNG